MPFNKMTRNRKCKHDLIIFMNIEIKHLRLKDKTKELKSLFIVIEFLSKMLYSKILIVPNFQNNSSNKNINLIQSILSILVNQGM